MTNLLDDMVHRLDFPAKNCSARHGPIWSAASVFSKKFQKWRQDHHNPNPKKHNNNNNNDNGIKEVAVSNQLDRFQVADFGHGRRSCDIAPRFSLDGCRMSLEDPRYSFDEPRASCDVHFLGRTIVSQAEMVPGGTSLTREYYADSSSRRRQSFDHSVSIRKVTSAFMDESKVSPATVLIDKSEIKGSKKSRRWMNGFNILGFFIHRRSKKSEKCSRSSTGVEGSPEMCVSWPEVRKEEKGFNPMMLRSKSSISFRNSYELGGINGNGKKIVLERNQSARSSSKEGDLQWKNSTRSVMRMY